MSKQDKKELRQQIACEWLEENYLQFGSLRHDVVTDRLQVRCAHNLGDEAIGRLGERQETWRNLTDKDINTMVCQCVAEKGVNISTNEMWTALKSDMVPAVHPLRAWLDGLRPYTADQPDWIDMVASQVKVKPSGEEAKGEETTWLSDPQTEQLNLHLLHEAGFHGQGITMAIIDGGFQNVDSMAAFDPIREQILGVYDMTDDADDIYGTTGGHGTKCFSTIAGITSDYTGAATAAEYYLIRSEEHLTESPKEMDNWVAAIELADSLGVDIASTSLGYAMFDTEEFTLSYADMDGQSTRCSHAAQIASRKGMLLVVAAGNEGNKDWHYISAPADADSILTVGAVDIHDSIAAFSSWGPTADGRVKPEVCAVGYQTALIDPIDNRVVRGNGTSFACPIIAGMAACLWSALPTASNIEIRERIIRSGDRYDSPHDQYGYGIPNAWQAYTQSTGLMTPGKGEQKAQKVIINGQLWIIHEGEVYNIIGVKSARNEKKRSNCFHN